MKKRQSSVGDVDSIYNALRPRMKNIAGSGGLSTTVPPHTHHASTIVVDPEPVDALLSADDSQEAHQELGMEKLARSGEQTWLGPQPLDMNHFDVSNVRDAEIESDLTMSGPVGQAIINNPRVVHMAGDHVDDEAKVDGLERVVFNNEPTASSIESPSRIDLNVGVEAGIDYTATEGRVSWDTLEDVLVAYVASGAGVVVIALGWAASIAVNGSSPS